MNRRNLRIFSMQMLYSMDLRNISLDEAIEFVNPDNYDEKAKIFLNNIVSKIDIIDEMISKNLKDYTLERLNLVDKEIIRIATYEILEGENDIKIIVNEALEITKMFSDQGDHKAVAFNNRLIQNIYLNKQV